MAFAHAICNSRYTFGGPRELAEARRRQLACVALKEKSRLLEKG